MHVICPVTFISPYYFLLSSWLTECMLKELATSALPLEPVYRKLFANGEFNLY